MRSSIFTSLSLVSLVSSQLLRLHKSGSAKRISGLTVTLCPNIGDVQPSRLIYSTHNGRVWFTANTCHTKKLVSPQNLVAVWTNANNLARQIAPQPPRIIFARALASRRRGNASPKYWQPGRALLVGGSHVISSQPATAIQPSIVSFPLFFWHKASSLYKLLLHVLFSWFIGYFKLH
jgi:hypothetical protein